jgi:glycosyltransferase involved in cell wall biosynthesis
MSAGPRVTFITHEATRTGAPRVLLSLMQWLKANSNFQISTLAARPGPLLPDFAALGPLVVLDGDWRHFHIVQRGIRLAVQVTAGNDRPVDSFVHRASGTALWMAKKASLRQLADCDLVYANSLQSGFGVRSMKSKAPLLAHLHELGDALLDPYERGNVETMCGRADEIIVPAKAVKELLVQRLGISEARVSVHYPFIDVEAHRPDPSARQRVRSELGIPDDAVVIGMSGGFMIRKAPDRLIDIAAKVLATPTETPIHFVWIGGTTETEYGRYMVTDIERLGIGQRFHIVREQADPRPYLAALDIFMLTSRSDPFPLVCLEAAAQSETPIVCFDQAGGMPELVGETGGIVVPYLDTDAAAAAILRLVAEPALRRKLGRQASQSVRAHHDITQAAPPIAAVMMRMLRDRATKPSADFSHPASRPLT